MNSLHALSAAALVSSSIVLFGCASDPSSRSGGDDESSSSLSGPTTPPATTTTTGGVEEHTRTLRDVKTPVVLTLDSKTVFCTARGYGSTVLKVSMPDLDWLAHFDHRVEGEGLPCITAGECTDTLGPSTILDTTSPRATATVRVVLTETITLDRTKKTCTRQLDEHVTSVIRGQDFSHERSGLVEPSDFDTCSDLVKLF